MKELLTDIRDLLQSEISYMRDGDIFISIATEFFPAHIRFPCIGVKDGNIERETAPGGMINKIFNVDISLFVNLPKKVAGALIGDSGNKGILDIEDDVHSILDDQGFDRFDLVFCRDSQRSKVLFVSESDIKLQKTLTYRYDKECVPR